ncbi:MAG: class I SAM-dependent methyltransferase [Candidatus Altiarchaeota archaeon]
MDYKEKLQEEEYDRPYHWLLGGVANLQYLLKVQIVIRIIGNLKSKKILDIGCGDGRFTSFLAKEGAEVYGVDYSERALRFAKVLVPNAKFVRMDSYRLGFKASYFDVVTLIDTIEHLKKDKEEQTLREIKKVLKPNGLVILSTVSNKIRVNKKHYRHYSEQQLREILGKYFSDIKIIGYVRYVPLYLKFVKYQNYPIISKIGRAITKECSPKKAVHLIAYGVKKS